MAKTGIIKFNCRDRMRKHRGKERNFDSAAMASVVNSPAVQERVAKGDMLGYYGHLPRVMFGMEPGEAAVHKGKLIQLEPAIATTTLRAFTDGTIEHEVEFLDNPSGRMAHRLHNSKRGGLSSAISCRTLDGAAVPYAFHGFDYVFEPNFSGNRGYLLDGVFDGQDGDGVPMTPGSVLDSADSPGSIMAQQVAEEVARQVLVLDGMYEALKGDYDRLLTGNSRLEMENNELLSLLSRKPEEVVRAAKLLLTNSLDSAAHARRRIVMPFRTSVEDSNLGQIAKAFDSAVLVQREKPEDARTAAAPVSTLLDDGLAMIQQNRGAFGI